MKFPAMLEIEPVYLLYYDGVKREIDKAVIMNDSRGEVVCSKLFGELPGWKKLVIGKESREKTRQIRNYEIRHKRSDECAIYSRL
ncbi:MAG: hypothetical protein KAR40_08540 [Candidatus Sabulitectum sp.]|nr:hypothetical protein [Candidatus Sabulitectum sp.]